MSQNTSIKSSSATPTAQPATGKRTVFCLGQLQGKQILSDSAWNLMVRAVPPTKGGLLGVCRPLTVQRISLRTHYHDEAALQGYEAGAPEFVQFVKHPGLQSHRYVLETLSNQPWKKAQSDPQSSLSNFVGRGNGLFVVRSVESDRIDQRFIIKDFVMLELAAPTELMRKGNPKEESTTTEAFFRECLDAVTKKKSLLATFKDNRKLSSTAGR